MAELTRHKLRAGQKLVAYQASVTDLEELKAAVAQAVEAIGNPGLAINCAVLPLLNPGARLALVASMAGFAANYSYAAYCASKFAGVGLGRVLRLELKPMDIEVSIICPPEVDTPMVTEEAKTMHPVSRTFKDLGGTLSVDEAMKGIIAGLDAGRHVIIPGFKTRLTYLCNRYLPDFIMNGVVDRVVRSVLNKTSAGAA
jgi:short-subunit dehydrogenase